ncbi:MAG: hypothetical protein ABSE17_03885 [Candidatus Levyibacteriota bacterium]|jgi:hypothetical protein
MPDIFIAEPKAESIIPDQPYSLQKQEGSATPLPINQPLTLPKNTVGLFSSFCKAPDGVSFQTQEEGEKILLFLRRDFATNIKWILISIILLVIPVLLPFVGKFFGNPFPFLSLKFYLASIVFYYLVVATYLYINFMTWYYNVALITDRRVIDVDFSNLVYKDVATTKLSLVQDLSYAKVGVIRAFFDYGDILIQTAGSLDNFNFESAPDPEEVVHIIEELIGKQNV